MSLENKEMFAMRTSLCDFSFSRNGADYDITAVVDSRQLEDPEEKSLTRGASATNKKGIVYTSSIKDPKTLTVVCVGLSKEYADMVSDMYQNEERTNFIIIDRKTGRKAVFRDAIFSKRPHQEQMSEGAEELNISLVLKSFNVEYA